MTISDHFKSHRPILKEIIKLTVIISQAVTILDCINILPNFVQALFIQSAKLNFKSRLTVSKSTPTEN